MGYGNLILLGHDCSDVYALIELWRKQITQNEACILQIAYLIKKPEEMRMRTQQPPVPSLIFRAYSVW